MPDILLVLGSATQPEYFPLKRAMTQRTGRTPKVVVVPWEYATTVPFIDAAYQEFLQRHSQGSGLVTRAEARFMLERPEQLEDVCIHQLFGQSSLEEVAALVFGARVDEDDDESAYRAPYPPFGWLTRRIPLETPAYRVELSESDGTPWLSGSSAFGDFQNLPKATDR